MAKRTARKHRYYDRLLEQWRKQLEKNPTPPIYSGPGIVRKPGKSGTPLTR